MKDLFPFCVITHIVYGYHLCLFVLPLEKGNLSYDENIVQATAVTVTLDFAFDSEILGVTPASMSKHVFYLCTWEKSQTSANLRIIGPLSNILLDLL